MERDREDAEKELEYERKEIKRLKDFNRELGAENQ